ncbi:MAG: hypothetical protein WBE18_04695, partial [Gammaproteobacteria bacterium]
AIYLCVAALLVLFDSTHILTSFRDSCKLVFHHWWHTFLFIIIIIFLIAILQTILMAPLNATSWLSMQVNLPFAWLINQLIGRIIVGALLFPAWIILILVIFHDLKLRIGRTQTSSLQI